MYKNEIIYDTLNNFVGTAKILMTNKTHSGTHIRVSKDRNIFK